MASCKLYSVALLVVILAAGPATRPVSAASAHLHFYMHDVLTGPSPTAVQVLNGPRGHFGDTIVIDDVLTEGASRSSSAVGRAQGHYIWASTGNPELLVTMNVVLTSGPYAGSSVTVVRIEKAIIDWMKPDDVDFSNFSNLPRTRWKISRCQGAGARPVAGRRRLEQTFQPSPIYPDEACSRWKICLEQGVLGTASAAVASMAWKELSARSLTDAMDGCDNKATLASW